MTRIFWGIIATVAGYYMVTKSEWLNNNISRLGFFDSKFATMGGSGFGWKLIGISVIFVGILMITNLTQGFVEWLASFFMPRGII